MNLASGLTFSNTVNVAAQGGSGTRIIPGDADNSVLINKLSGNPPFGSQMPLGGLPLSQTNINTIRNWILQGAQNN